MAAASLVERHDLWDAEQREAAERALAVIDERGLRTVRFAFADQHGLLRGKTLVADETASAMRSGVGVTTTLLAKDTSHRTVFPVFSAGGGFGMREMQGAADMLMVADPTTFRVLPWAPDTGWLLCDLYFHDGRPVPYDTRQLFRAIHRRLETSGYDLVAGLEVEFHLFRLLDPSLRPTDAGAPGQPGEPPRVELLTQGYQYLTELRYDQLEPALEVLRRELVALGVPLRSLEVEFGPSQCEFTFRPEAGIRAPDLMVLLRSAVKQVARRHGYHATFMCRPRIPNVMSSGWHLHQSLSDRRTGVNAFVASEPGELLSPLGRHFLGGLIAHAPGATPFTTPTINGYKRYRPNSLAPDRVSWARDNRAAMLRLPCGPNDPASRIENRVGEPAANPYLYMASQIVAGMDGVARALDPGPSADSPYDTPATTLPVNLDAALDCLRADPVLCEGFGQPFIDYFVHIKRAEIARFAAEVTDWEHREYFDLF
jgi:glutamine synthetase